jgi:arylsulfatase A-like enzyme
MEPNPGISTRRLAALTIALYLVIWAAEAASKIVAVLDEYANNDLKSTLTARLGEGIRALAPSLLLYVLTLVSVYVVFAVLNAQYSRLLGAWIGRRRPRMSRSATVGAFLAVNGVFLAGVSGLNAALYPASNLASIKGPASLAGAGPGLRSAALVLLGLYLAGFILLTVRYARGAARVLSLVFWAVILVAPLDPAYLIHRAFRSAGPAHPGGPNVIMIGLDSLNPRHTGYGGYPLPLTPNLDAFLKDNVVFSNCWTPIARTFPSWYAILTGEYPVTNGVRFNLQKRKTITSAGQCLGHVFQARGYKTLHFTDEVRFSNITAEEGFDVLRHPVMGVRDFLFGNVHDFSLTNVFFNNPAGGLIFPFLRFNRAVSHLYDGRYFINDLVRTIDGLKTGGRPFFLVAHLCIGHWPFFHASPREFAFRPGADPRMALYDSAQAIVDAQLGRILAALKANGLYEDSLVIVLSDHGESAEGHGVDLRGSEQNRTLLAFKPAGPAAHREVGQLVRTIDIAPTVFDLMGFETAGRKFDGLSLKPWILGTDGPGTPAPDSALLETEFSLLTPGGIGLALQSLVDQGVKFYEFDRTGLITVRDDYFDILVRRRNRALLTPEWKYVREVLVRPDGESVKTSLFDLRRDPACEKDVSGKQQAVARALGDRLDRYYGAEVAAAPAASPGAPPAYTGGASRTIMTPKHR